MITIGWMLLLAITGSLFIIWTKKRQFDRANEMGVEVFESFSQKAKLTILDGLLLLIGHACITGAGLILLIILLKDNSIFSWILIFIIGIGLSREFKKIHRS